MDGIEMFQRLGTAVAIGAIVGAERHWRERDAEDSQRTAGLRTFSLIGMLGGAAGLIAHAFPQAPMAAAVIIAGLFIAFSAVFALYQYREAVAENNRSVTTVVAAMLTFALGAVAVLGDLPLASAGGVTTVAILASRDMLHAFMRRITWAELRSAIILLGMTFVVLPLVPDAPVGPFGGISPAKTWLLVVILAAISFSGYVAVKLLGSARGELVAGALGGLISSTGATLTNARRSTTGEDVSALTAGALGACAVSYIRTAVLVAALAAPLGAILIAPLAAAAAAMVGCALFFARASAPDHPEQPAKNPFDLDAVIRMALLLVVIAFLARAAAHWFGDRGLILVSALSGLADVDAAVVTVAGMLGQLDRPVAVMAIVAAVVANTLAKAGYAVAFGTTGFGLRFAAGSAVAIAAGAGVHAAASALVPT
jgi:Predicted membrane protein